MDRPQAAAIRLKHFARIEREMTLKMRSQWPVLRAMILNDLEIVGCDGEITTGLWDLAVLLDYVPENSHPYKAG